MARSLGPLNQGDERNVGKANTAVVRIPGNADIRYIMHLITPTLSQVGVQCSVVPSGDAYNYMYTSTFKEDLIFKVDKLSDDLYYRSKLSASADSIRNENKKLKDYIKTLEKKNAKLQDESDSIKKILDAKQEKKKKKEKENTLKELSYEEKVKWFCQNYEENFDIMIESLKDDDLDNLFWKGSKVKFPKTRKEMNERSKNE